MSKSPFILVPWQDDFMQAVLNVALDKSSDISKALFIFPHARPARYLERLIREDKRIKKPCLMPESLTGSQLFKTIFDETHSPAQAIGNLDRVGLLLGCLRDEQHEHPGVINNIPTTDAKAFFPWGNRLAGIFEECFSYQRVPDSFIHLEDELMPFASAILSRMGSLYSRYLAALDAHGWVTPGLIAKRAVEALDEGQTARILEGRKNIYLCGFHSLNGTENSLFKHLWLKAGAEIIIHADPKLAEGRGHWTCTPFNDWLKAWGAGLDSLECISPAVPQISYYAGYDVHSQLAFLRSSIHKQGEEHGRELEDTAVILPDTSLLLPVLHHIQADDVNISMGYPLSNTALQRFLDAVLDLHKNAREGFYWKDCIRLLRQPYIKMLDENIDANGRNTWRELLLKAEHRLREGRRYVDFAQLIASCLKDIEDTAALKHVSDTWEKVRLVCLESWRNIHSLEDLGLILEQIVNLLLEKGENIWPRFPIDAECLSRFAQSLIPELKNSALAQEKLPQNTIFAIFHELAQAERVPFDAYPLTVLQIMGLLESRLLSFKNVFILDATDDILPGSAKNDPLLPDSLRAELGLPDAARRQRLTAYYFFRLLQSAENVHIFWQEGVEPQGVLDDKKLRSRFVEELLWGEEQKIGRLLEPTAPVATSAPELPLLLQDGPLFQISSKLVPFHPENRNIPVDENIRARLAQILSGPISATRLNSYLRCPAAFYYRELASIRPTQEVIEEEDPASVGNLFHQVLKDYYSAQMGRPLQNAALNRGDLIRLYKKAMQESLAIDDMAADAQLMLGIAGERRLRTFLDKQPEETLVRALEIPVNAPLSIPEGKTFQLFGYLDRIDERMQADGKPGLIILDYKTGRINPLPPEIWSNNPLWQRLESDDIDLNSREFFSQISDQIQDVQLPFYLYLSAFGRAEISDTVLASGLGELSSVCNAGWVALREKGEEHFIFPDALSRELRLEIIDNKISLLLEYILRHLSQTENFFPRPGPYCEYCEYRNICIVLF